MPASTFKLSVQIGAVLANSFKNAIGGSRHQLNLLGASLNKLKGQQAAIGQFELAEANVGKARIAYQKAAQDVTRLKQAMAKTQKPTQTLSNEFARAQAKSEQLSGRLEKQRERLRKTRQALSQAGLSTRNLVVDNARLGASIDRLNAKYKKLGAATQAQTNNKNKRSELRGQLFDAVAIGAAVAVPINIAIGFEQSIAKLGAISRADGEVLQSLSNEAQRLGAETFFSASQSAEAMQFLAMAGFETGEILEATAGVLDLAQASGADLGRTADIASNILSGFSLEADEMTRVGNALVGTFTTSNTQLESLGESMKMVAPIASKAGASIEEVSAMIGLLGDVSIQGSMAGTALRAAFIRLAAPPTKAANALASLGVETQETNGNLRSMPDILNDISDSTKNLGSAERLALVSEIFGVEAASAMTALITQVEKFDKTNEKGLNNLKQKIKNLEEQQILAADVAKKMGETTAGSLKRLGSALEAVSISLGSVLLPTIAAGADRFARMASVIAKTAREFPLVTKVVVGLTVGLAALKVVAIAGGFAYTFLKGGVLSLVAAYRVLTASLALVQIGMIKLNVLSSLSAIKIGVVTLAQWAWNVAMMANPIGLIVIGIGSLIALGVLVVKHWDTIKNFFSEFWDGLKTKTASTVSFVKRLILGLLKPFMLITQVSRGLLGSVFGDEGSADSESEQSTTPQRRSASAALLGSALASTTAFAAPTPTATLPTDVGGAPITNVQSVKIDAPITVNASPGMDTREIAAAITQELDDRQARANAARRGNLFDEVDA